MGEARETDQEKEPSATWIWIVGGVSLAAVIALSLALPSIIRCWVKPTTPSEAGAWGDQFGSLNTLFSGMAFVGVVVAILLQRHELQLQRRQLELQIKEVNDTQAIMEESKEEQRLMREQMELQAQIMRDQSAQPIISMCIQAVVDAGDRTGDEHHGIDHRFQTVIGALRGEHKSQTNKGPIHHQAQSMDIDSIRARLKEQWPSHRGWFQPFVDSFHYALVVIDQYAKDDDEWKARLRVRLLTSRLTSVRLLLLFYVVHSDLCPGNLKRLASKYELWRGLDSAELIDPLHQALVGDCFRDSPPQPLTDDEKAEAIAERDAGLR